MPQVYLLCRSPEPSRLTVPQRHWLRPIVVTVHAVTPTSLGLHLGTISVRLYRRKIIQSPVEHPPPDPSNRARVIGQPARRQQTQRFYSVERCPDALKSGLSQARPSTSRSQGMMAMSPRIFSMPPLLGRKLSHPTENEEHIADGLLSASTLV